MKLAAVLVLCVTLFCQGNSNSLDSCRGRCGYGTDSGFSCQCNPSCERYGDCCSDYYAECKDSALSCKGRCNENYNSQNECHCNSKCPQYNNCCNDYTDLCDSSSGGGAGTITDAELKSVSEALYALDSNKASASQLSINPQTLVSDSQTSLEKDLSSMPLFSYVNENALFSKPTYAALLAVLDNYHRMTGTTENFSSRQLTEQETFVKETMSRTEVGRELFTFLYTKGVYASEEEFLQDLKTMWFGLYSRNNGKLDSSGFEHIFAGEIKGGKVSGFHNWIQFYLLEKRGELNYYSHSFNGPWTSYPDILGMQFMWEGYFKQVGSAVIGCSPEFDFAIYSLCYIARPGKQCRLSLAGKELIIQTYTWDNSSYGNGKKYIGSAFPATP
ncbi:uridylate-specific endoribonuclease A isoform X1 [Acanthochromis polyacanthus]|uniref:Uridylate-specific endoribonuclease n=1 Tax=Acanthochromis polyacanthus TaxID=80966 RepID=A0A3Q1F8G0_9TELE|nr:uridylate-specific endoribonuclease A isoform X1 [Acanthochromis polyacanthus]